jgi:hypothetical protein
MNLPEVCRLTAGRLQIYSFNEIPLSSSQSIVTSSFLPNSRSQYSEYGKCNINPVFTIVMSPSWSRDYVGKDIRYTQTSSLFQLTSSSINHQHFQNGFSSKFISRPTTSKVSNRKFRLPYQKTLSLKAGPSKKAGSTTRIPGAIPTPKVI